MFCIKVALEAPLDLPPAIKVIFPMYLLRPWVGSRQSALEYGHALVQSRVWACFVLPGGHHMVRGAYIALHWAEFGGGRQFYANPAAPALECRLIMETSSNWLYAAMLWNMLCYMLHGDLPKLAHRPHYWYGTGRWPAREAHQHAPGIRNSRKQPPGGLEPRWGPRIWPEIVNVTVSPKK